jgi:hypothetical protein
MRSFQDRLDVIEQNIPVLFTEELDVKIGRAWHFATTHRDTDEGIEALNDAEKLILGRLRQSIDIPEEITTWEAFEEWTEWLVHSAPKPPEHVTQAVLDRWCR